ncbi:SREBP regulating gene protein-like isoform X2 [Choloepus didactylus]|uniref:SREBP regulating gene protein-like isoform X2 n=1 Tax=Choloepus didactylus TaxID=27675 RepID=UPI00189FA07A|nr:SREBP regulating gene protein-like isoform X2 [Choloepus didactylus]
MANLAAVMWCRLLQKRWMLTLVFWLSLIYFLTSTWFQSMQHENTDRNPIAKYC